MSDREARKGRPRSSRVRSVLPVVAVDSREKMAILLAKNGRLLRDYARHNLGERGTDDEVEEVVERTVDAVLDAEFQPQPHALRYVTAQLWRECEREVELRGRRRYPVDRRLGALTGPVARVLEQLGPRSRQTIRRAAEGWTPLEQAQADNTTVETIHVRLHRARRRAQELLKDAGHSSSALVLALPARVRRGGHRIAAWCRHHVTRPAMWPSCSEPISQLAAVTVLAIGGGGSIGSALAPAPSSAAPHTEAGLPPTPPTSPAVVAFTATRPAIQRPTTAASRPGTSSPGEALPPPDVAPRGLLRNVAAGNETPEDAQLVTASAPADYASTHTIVALGIGHSCACSVLFQSTDGGTTWTASKAAAPAAADQLALPPTYPADPRIFVGTSARSGGSAYVVPQFDATATPLPGPAGDVALAAGFDRGDSRVFIAAQNAVMSLSVDATPPILMPLLLYPQWMGGPASLATAAGVGGTAVEVLAPPGTFAEGDPTAGETQAPVLFICGTGTSCVRRGTPPADALVLAASSFDAMTAVSLPRGAALSADGGQSFVATPGPAGVTSVPSVASVGGRLWALMQHGSAVAVMWASAPGGAWQDVTAADAGLRSSLALVAIPNGPVLDLLSGRGLRCTADGGKTWGTRCP